MNQEISWQHKLNQALSQAGLTQYGISALTKPMSVEFYRRWIQSGYHAGMTYLDEHQERKENPKSLLPSAKSLISIAIPYSPHPKPAKIPFHALKVARYAKGADYHHWFLAKIQQACGEMKTQYPDEEFLCFTDSQPIFEKEWAARNNLGWIGKNSLLLNKEMGSLFFIGEILTSLEASPESEFVVPDHCGKCDRCIVACPTDAILEDRSLDASRCLAYLNIEAKTAAPEPIRSQFHSWLFGCDICQDVCPWNSKVLSMENQDPDSDLETELFYILENSNKKLMKDLKGTPLTRAGGNGLKRTALCIIGGSKIRSVKDRLQALTFQNEELRTLQTWTLSQLNS